jgi:hypothetical protein
MPCGKLLLAGAVALPALALGFAACRWEGPRWAPKGLSWEEEWRRELDLDARRQVLLRASQARRQIHVDLIEQRLTYAEAVAALRAENEQRPLPSHLYPFPGRTREEKYSWMLLLQIAWHLADSPQPTPVMPRIRAQCRRHLARIGADTGADAAAFARALQTLELPANHWQR